MGTDLAGILGHLSGNGMLLEQKEQDVDFFIHELMPLPFFGDGVYLTTTHVCTLIVMLTIIIFAIIARIKLNKAKEIPDGFQNVLEFAVETLDNFVNSTMGKMGSKYINYIGALFLFIFLSNISGLFGLRPPTADYGTTLSMALISFVLIQYCNVKNN